MGSNFPKAFALLLAAAAAAVAACRPAPEPPAAPAAIRVAATNPPLAFFAAEILGGTDGFELFAATPPGRDSIDWLPDDETIARVQSSPLILLQGPGSGPWGESIPLPRRGRIDTTRAARDRFPKEFQGVRHRHGGGAEHTHGGTSAYAWLDFETARVQARAVRDALVGGEAAAEPALDERWRHLDARLASLHRRAIEIAAGAPPLLASHPVYAFLAHAYGLRIESVAWSPDEMPDAEAWADLDARREASGAAIMLWEAPPAAAIAEALRQRGIVTVPFATGSVAPEAAKLDLVAMLEANLDRLAEAIGEPAAASPGREQP
jgi:zinc transport system substrate-binding protein